MYIIIIHFKQPLLTLCCAEQMNAHFCVQEKAGKLP